jgi:hypothetical protein
MSQTDQHELGGQFVTLNKNTEYERVFDLTGRSDNRIDAIVEFLADKKLANVKITPRDPESKEKNRHEATIEYTGKKKAAALQKFHAAVQEAADILGKRVKKTEKLPKLPAFQIVFERVDGNKYLIRKSTRRLSARNIHIQKALTGQPKDQINNLFKTAAKEPVTKEDKQEAAKDNALKLKTVSVGGPRSGYNIFCKQYVIEEETSFGEASKQRGEAWRALTDKQKNKYNKKVAAAPDRKTVDRIQRTRSYRKSQSLKVPRKKRMKKKTTAKNNPSSEISQDNVLTEKRTRTPTKPIDDAEWGRNEWDEWKRENNMAAGLKKGQSF